MAQVKGGVYTYSKGLNKAQSHAYIVPVSPDSVFIYIHSVGPAPEFNTDVVRGWLIGEGNKRYLTQGGDSLSIAFTPSTMRIQSTGNFANTALAGQYRLLSTQLKQMPAMLFPHASFTAKLAGDTLLPCYSAPSVQAPVQVIPFARIPVTVLDQFGPFYLVEHPKHKRAFLWVRQAQFVVPKKTAPPKKS